MDPNPKHKSSLRWFLILCLFQVELVRLFLRHGADANVRGWARDWAFPEPPLHVAIRKACVHQVRTTELSTGS